MCTARPIMMIVKVLFFILATATSINAQTYIAAVIEYAPLTTPALTPEENVLRNVQRYVEFIGQARSQSANIIVFAEYGLTTNVLPSDLTSVSTTVPEASLRVAPCDTTANFATFFVHLSCGARTHGIHTVVNLIESEARNNTNGTNTTIFYNTNVVFDGTGTVIARYRKINLYNEPQLTAGNDLVTFSAFDVTFGLITSFDIAFRRPGQEILLSGATDVIYPMAWPSETPFAHALSLQDGYAKAAGINMLVSGYNNGTSGTVGAGIFLANATIARISIEAAAVQNLLIAPVNRIIARTPGAICLGGSPRTSSSDVPEVPADDTGAEPAPFVLDTEDEYDEMSPRFGGSVPDLTRLTVMTENMENYTFQALEMNVNSTQGVICSEGSNFCCNYTIEFNSPLTSNSTVYRVAAFDGRRVFPGLTTVGTIGIKVCALVACSSDANRDCGRLNGTTNVNFRRITIVATLDTNNTIYQPATLTFAHRPLTNYAYCTNQETGVLNVTMTVDNPQSLFSFGIFGRVYDSDGLPAGRSGANTVQFSVQTIFAIISVYFYLKFVY